MKTYCPYRIAPLGAGFNGSSLALVEKDKLDNVKENIKDKYISLYPELKDSFKIVEVVITDGVELWKQKY